MPMALIRCLLYYLASYGAGTVRPVLRSLGGRPLIKHNFAASPLSKWILGTWLAPNPAEHNATLRITLRSLRKPVRGRSGVAYIRATIDNIGCPAYQTSKRW